MGDPGSALLKAVQVDDGMVEWSSGMDLVAH